MTDPSPPRGFDGNSRRAPRRQAKPSALPHETGNGFTRLDEQIASLLDSVSVGTASGGRRAGVAGGTATAVKRVAPGSARPLRRRARAEPIGGRWQPALRKTARYGLIVIAVTLVGVAIGVLSVYLSLYVSR